MSAIMTYGEYIKALHSTGLFSGSREQLAADIVEKSSTIFDCTVEFNTAKSWIYQNRTPDTDRCFRFGEMANANFFDFFKSIANTSWSKIQNAFQSLNCDDDFLINLTTKKPDVFYWSLLRQFQKIWKLPLSEDPVDTMLTRFKRAIREHHIEEIICFPNEHELEERLSDDEKAALIWDWIDEALPQIDACWDAIRADIIKPFEDKHHNDDTYRLIQRFYDNLSDYGLALQPIEAFMGYASFPSDPLELSRILYQQYKKICGDVEEDATEYGIESFLRYINRSEEEIAEEAASMAEAIQKREARERMNEMIICVAKKRYNTILHSNRDDDE